MPKSQKKKAKRKIPNRYVIIFLGLGFVLLTTFVLQSRRENLGPILPPPPNSALYRQPNEPIEKRVADLLSRMTLEEKIGQMSLVDKNSLGKIEDVSRYSLGGVLSGAGAKPEENNPDGWLELVSGIKNQADNSRLGIPLLYGVDANHGHGNVLGATIFPHAIGLGSANDENLVKSVSKATAEELKATGINWSYSPSLDAPKDIRWGRVYEGFSDNPSLISALGSAYITGTQTPDSGSFVLATAKHYLATGAMQWGESNHKSFKIDQGKTIVDERALNEEYLPPYKAAVDANVSSVMIGLNQWGDQRIIDSHYLITEKLKQELGFEGFVVSDWYGVYEYAKTRDYQANINAINAGVDMAMLPYDYKSFLSDVRHAVKSGEISQERIDDAVSRILRKKFEAGLFDASGAPAISRVGSTENRQLARQAVAKSAVLLKNQRQTLPLQKENQRIIIAGSGADNVGRQSGAWTVEWQGVDGNWMPGGTSILQGMKDKVSGSSVIEFNTEGEDYELAGNADVGVVVVSEDPYAEGLGDNADPGISEVDLATIERVKAKSNKLVVVIVSGRPLIITNQIASWDALVAAWLPGSEGAGLGDVLFGDQKFSGKLPLPWPQSIEQLPLSASGETNDGSAPLFTRGFGL